MEIKKAVQNILEGAPVHETLLQVVRESQDPDLVQLNMDLRAVGFKCYGLTCDAREGMVMYASYEEDTTKFKWGPSAEGDHVANEEIGYTRFDPSELDQESFETCQYAVEKAKPILDHYLSRKGLEGTVTMTPEWPENAICITVTSVPHEESVGEPGPEENPEPEKLPGSDDPEWTE